MKDKEKALQCEECAKLQLENNFYKIITEKLNNKTGEYEPYRICKKCITSDYSFGFYSDKDRIYNMCEKYNLYYNDSIVDEVISSEKEYKFGDYLRIISSLRQYQDKKFKDSVFENSKEEQNKESDIDFINNDIIQLKRNIKKALDNYDYNAHNKWMNSLRDAIELRDKLQGNKNYVINIGTINSNTNDAEELVANLIRLAKENSSIYG
jgi:hypothetical protein